MSVAPPEPEPSDVLLRETRAFWRETGQALVRGSVETLDETARQIITVAGILEGLYFHAIAFGDLHATPPALLVLVAYLAPIVLLLLSLIAALLVFIPDHYRLNIHSSEAGRQVHAHVVASKLRYLRGAAFFLIVGVLAIIPAVLVYLYS
ncbi:MAG TPA: hypothetical protein VER55_16410 [Ardenticatenaceae bacterium]|nr:hypothetical protein [Ardenticatenaceae bacterium]